jgi:hypothetical protein
MAANFGLKYTNVFRSKALKIGSFGMKVHKPSGNPAPIDDSLSRTSCLCLWDFLFKKNFCTLRRCQIHVSIHMYTCTYITVWSEWAPLLKMLLLARWGLHSLYEIRVTRWVCEKIAQAVAKPIFCQNLYITKVVQNFGLLLWFIKTTKVNNHPIGENSPNLVTLYAIKVRRHDCIVVIASA